MTMAETTLEAVRREILVNVPPERAFEVFTERFDAWWPHGSHHIGAADMAEAVLEPREGGRWYERGVDGSERATPSAATADGATCSSATPASPTRRRSPASRS